MSLYGIFKRNGKNGFGYNTTAEMVTDGLNLSGKTILITGCNSGIGRESARVLAKRGATIIGSARTLEKAEEVCKTLGNNSFGVVCELSDPKSIKECLTKLKKSVKKIDVIIGNAGVMALPRLTQIHGYELQFFTNHIGHFILINGLLDTMAPDGRIVMVSSDAHKMAPADTIEFENLDGKKNYKPWKAYGQSKMANILFVKELSRKVVKTGITVNALHPGVIQTNLWRHMNPVVNGLFSFFGKIALKSIPQGAATTCYAAVHPDMKNISGQYLADCNITSSRPDSNDAELAAKLWKKSEEIVSVFK